MKINELSGYKQDPLYQKAVEVFNDYTLTTMKKLDKYAEYMTTQGFTVLGSGIAGLVIEKSGYPWVFKIFHDDLGYLWYINYARQHQDNPHVPKMKGGVAILSKDNFYGNLYLVRIEKLSPLLRRDSDKKVIDAIGNVDDLTPETAKLISKTYPTMLPVLQAIVGSGYAVDLHRGNMMVRKDGTLVITDPLIG